MSASPPPSSRSRLRATDPDRRRVLPWLLSAAVHVAVLAWWASLPEPDPPKRPTEDDLRPIELVELPPIAVEPTRPAEPVLPAEPTLPAEPPEPADPSEPDPSAPSDPSPPDPRPTAPHRTTDEAHAGDPTAPSEPTTPLEPTTPEEPGGVALLGLRSGSRTSRAAPSLRPDLPPPKSALGHGRVVREVAAAGSSDALGRDGKPRSLSEAGFKKRRDGSQVFRDTAGRFKATLKADGRIVFRDMPVAVGRDPVTGVPKMGMPGLAEGLRAASGQELYQQEKRRLLEDTFDLRLQLAISFAQDKVDRRLKSLYRELLDQWQDDRTSEAERRRSLFQRWDECEEGLPVALPGFSSASTSELDDLRRTAGAQARETIERFVERQLPAGSPQAYTADELRRLNASRRSQARFEPYR